MKATGDKGTDKHITYYYCNRSGYHNRKGQGQRQTKLQGTSKMNAYCTAAIVVTKNDKEMIQAQIYKTHYGHQLSLGHLRLQKCQREAIAAQLSQGITPQHVLDKIRDSVHKRFERIHLITKKDIRNVEKSFGLCGSERHKDDAVSVRLWVEEMRQSDSNPVLLYKEQGESDEVMSQKDFLLSLQTPFQAHMLQSCGHDNIVCIDSTHGTNTYDFALTTVVVVDEFGEGYPVAWCLSNRTDTPVLTCFFKSIKAKIGIVAPKWLMTDDAEQFYNAWINAFGGNPHKLLCTWHVDRAWRGHLLSLKSQELSQTIYHNLRVLLEETNEEKFEHLLKDTQTQLAKSPAASKFSDYFIKYYIPRKCQWAVCYRKGSRLNTNMYVEAFHRVLKHIYMKGTCNKRIDKCIHVLLKLERDKAFERLIKLEKGKISARLSVIRKRHLASQKLSSSLISVVNNNTWSVQSSTDSDKSYTVEKDKHECNGNCALKCQECNICVDTYSCNCSDALIHHTICKHIHLIASTNHHLASKCASTSFDQDHDSLLAALQTNVSEASHIKNTIIRELSSLSTQVQQCENLSALSTVNTVIKTANNAMKLNISDSSQLHPVSNEPVNKKISLQRPFYSTKKKSKKPSLRLVKPSQMQKNEIRLKLNEDTLYCSEEPSGNL